MVKHLPAMQETQVRSLGWKDLLEKGLATHSSTLAWKIPWTEEPGRLQSMGLQRVGQNWATSLSHYKNVVATDFFPPWTSFLFLTFSGHWTLLSMRLSSVWFGWVWLHPLTTRWARDPRWPGCPVQIIGLGRVMWSKPKNQRLPQDVSPQNRQEKGNLSPLWDCELLRLMSAWHIGGLARVCLRIGPTQRETGLSKEDEARNMITFEPVASARPEGSAVDFPVVWAN